MEPKIIPFTRTERNDLTQGVPNPLASLVDIFSSRHSFYEINESLLFCVYFNAIPNFIEEIDIDCKKANRWFQNHFKEEIKDSYFKKRYFGANKKAELDDIFYFIEDDLLVNFDTNNSTVRFLFNKTNPKIVEKVIEKIKRFRKRKSAASPEMSLLMNGNSGIELRTVKIAKPKLHLDDNYNDDFNEIHQTIRSRLAKNNDKGLVLLHGKPGTGKTSYIRYLIASVKKNVIFLPPNMANAITNPDLISILIKNPNSVLVIEDAENIIMNRERNGQSPVSALLNISDGLLADCLNIQLICSFNTDISKVDNALLRKGRLIAKYEFKELVVAKANALSQKLGFDSTFDNPVSLATIYNQNEQNFESTQRKKIGFRN